MLSIIPINTILPTLEDFYEYEAGGSLQDHDIVLFDPGLPYYDTEHFSDGQIVLSRTGGARAIEHMAHWNSEISNALNEGKTVFVLLNEKVSKKYITGVGSSTRTNTTYNTTYLDNYSAIPLTLNVVNSSGSLITVTDPRFKDLHSTLKEVMTYKAYLPGAHNGQIFSNKGKSNTLGAVIKQNDRPGHLVLLPYFNLSTMYKTNKSGEDVWTKQALGLSTKLVKQLVEIDRMLREGAETTPKPEWVDDQPRSKKSSKLIEDLKKIEKAIEEKIEEKSDKETQIAESELPTRLLYETGKPLESAIEDTLRSLKYTVTNYDDGTLEIDHIIISPSGKRLIGEAEGKDNSAIGITKFRQLETNINEDFERDDVIDPASGILFGNGFRLKKPDERPDQFTEKCLKNAKRLDTVLVKTSDLYNIAVYLQDNDDDDYRNKCRKVLESSSGKVAIFPPVPDNK